MTGQEVSSNSNSLRNIIENSSGEAEEEESNNNNNSSTVDAISSTTATIMNASSTITASAATLTAVTDNNNNQILGGFDTIDNAFTSNDKNDDGADVINCNSDESFILECFEGEKIFISNEKAQIIKTRCEFFRNVFEHGTRESTTKILCKPDWNVNIAKHIVQLLTTNQTSVPVLPPPCTLMFDQEEKENNGLKQQEEESSNDKDNNEYNILHDDDYYFENYDYKNLVASLDQINIPNIKVKHPLSYFFSSDRRIVGSSDNIKDNIQLVQHIATTWRQCSIAHQNQNHDSSSSSSMNNSSQHDRQQFFYLAFDNQDVPFQHAICQAWEKLLRQGMPVLHSDHEFIIQLEDNDIEHHPQQQLNELDESTRSTNSTRRNDPNLDLDQSARSISSASTISRRRTSSRRHSSNHHRETTTNNNDNRNNHRSTRAHNNNSNHRRSKTNSTSITSSTFSIEKSLKFRVGYSSQPLYIGIYHLCSTLFLISSSSSPSSSSSSPPSWANNNDGNNNNNNNIINNNDRNNSNNVNTNTINNVNRSNTVNIANERRRSSTSSSSCYLHQEQLTNSNDKNKIKLKLRLNLYIGSFDALEQIADQLNISMSYHGICNGGPSEMVTFQSKQMTMTAAMEKSQEDEQQCQYEEEIIKLCQILQFAQNFIIPCANFSFATDPHINNNLNKGGILILTKPSSITLAQFLYACNNKNGNNHKNNTNVSSNINPQRESNNATTNSVGFSLKSNEYFVSKNSNDLFIILNTLKEIMIQDRKQQQMGMPNFSFPFNSFNMPRSSNTCSMNSKISNTSEDTSRDNQFDSNNIINNSNGNNDNEDVDVDNNNIDENQNIRNDDNHCYHDYHNFFDDDLAIFGTGMNVTKNCVASWSRF